MEKVIYGNNQGLGIVLDEFEQIDDFVLKSSVVLHGNILEPGSWTDLDRMFSSRVRYEGLLKGEDHNIMVFFIGVDADLSEHKSFYQCFYWLNETRIGNKYKEGTFRDFNWKDNKWK
ncbi:MAG: hypothetical protein U0T77_10620 [Chitinophagales bacterium]